MRLIATTAAAVLAACLTVPILVASASPARAEQAFYELHILFSKPGMLEPHVPPGYGARKAESLKDCRQKRRTLIAYFSKKIKNPAVKFKVFCVEYKVRGYDEAVEAFRHQIGDPA